MTEEQIERHVERQMDAADHAFMLGRINQSQYDGRVAAIDEWARVGAHRGDGFPARD